MRLENFVKKAITPGMSVVTWAKDEVTGEELTPHVLMEKALEMYENVPLVKSGIDQIALFIVGSGVNVESEDEYTRDFVQAWVKQRKQRFMDTIQNCCVKYLVAGNAYTELSFLDDDGLQLDNLFDVPDPSKIFFNPSHKTNADYWIVKVAFESQTKVIVGHNEVKVAKYFPYKYSLSSIYWNQYIKGYTEYKQKFEHLRTNYTFDGRYGYSFLMAALRSGESINKIMRNVTNIAAQKAVGRKMIGVFDDSGRIISKDDMLDLQDQLNTDNFDDIIVDKKIDVQELGPSQYDTMMNEIDFARKELSSGLLPTYMTPWNSDVNRASAEQARVPFIAFIEKHRERVEDFFTGIVSRYLMKMYPKLKEFELKFDGTDFYSIEEKKDFYESLYSENVITLNEYRSKLGLSIMEGGDVYSLEFNETINKKIQGGEPDIPRFENVRRTEAIIQQHTPKGRDINLLHDEASDLYSVKDGEETVFSIKGNRKEAEKFYNDYREKISNNEDDLYDFPYDSQEKEVSKVSKKMMSEMGEDLDQLLKAHSR